MSNTSNSVELPRNRLTFLDVLKMGFTLLPLCKHTLAEDSQWDILELKPYPSNNDCLGTAEITIYRPWKIQKLEAHCHSFRKLWDCRILEPKTGACNNYVDPGRLRGLHETSKNGGGRGRNRRGRKDTVDRS